MIKKRYSNTEWAWAFFDWANSAFATTVMAGLFPIFFKSYYASNLTSQDSTFYLGLCLSISGLIVAILNPFLGFLTDLYNNKKIATLLSSCLSLVSLIGLFFTFEAQWLQALLLYGLSLVGFQLALSFYDSLLNAITSLDRQHRLSALGYALGYLGGGLLFALNVVMVQKPEWFGLTSKIEGVKWSFLSVVAWWLIFSWPFFKYIAEKKPTSKQRVKALELVRTFHQSLVTLVKDRNVAFFLAAYWLFIDAVYTIINMATDYGTAIGLEAGDLIKALLLVQFLGFPFSILAGHLTLHFSVKKILISLLGIYVFATLWAMQMSQAWEFWLLASLIAMAQGGVQSLSRSLFASLIPDEKSGEYFGVFNLIGRFAAILGPLIVGGLTVLSGSHRLALLGLLFPLLLGMTLLGRVHTHPSRS